MPAPVEGMSNTGKIANSLRMASLPLVRTVISCVARSPGCDHVAAQSDARKEQAPTTAKVQDKVLRVRGLKFTGSF